LNLAVFDPYSWAILLLFLTGLAPMHSSQKNDLSTFFMASMGLIIGHWKVSSIIYWIRLPLFKKLADFNNNASSKPIPLSGHSAGRRRAGS
jgi:hypothetical protein